MASDLKHVIIAAVARLSCRIGRQTPSVRDEARRDRGAVSVFPAARVSGCRFAAQVPRPSHLDIRYQLAGGAGNSVCE